MRAQGYILIRSHGRHEVYANPINDHQVSVPNHSSGGNGGLINKIVLAVERGFNRYPGMEEDHVPEEKTESPRYLNDKHAKGFSNKISLPSPVTDTVPEAPKVPDAGRNVGSDGAHAKGSDQVQAHGKGSNEMKHLSDSDFEAIKKMKETGASYEKIAAHLNLNGYTNAYGDPLDKATVSEFMVQRGFRVMPAGITRNRASKKEAAVPKLDKEAALLHEVSDLLTSNLADAMKIKFLVSLVKEKFP